MLTGCWRLWEGEEAGEGSDGAAVDTGLAGSVHTGV